MGGNGNGNGNDNGKGKEHPLESNNNLIPPPPPHTPQPCPRCFSTTTKFCYYNNRSVSQPRYFCKSCKRHWTLGGALRNVPIGGGCRTGTKKTLKGDHSSGSMTSCSSLDKGESSRVQKHLSPPQQTQPPLPIKPQPVLARMNDISNMNFSFVDSFTFPGGISGTFASMQNLNLTQGFNQVPSIGGSNVGGIQGTCSTNDILLNGSSSKPNLTRPPHILQPVNQFNNGQQAIAQPNRTIDSLTQALTSHPSGSNINATWVGSNNITESGFVMNNQNQWSDEYYVDNVDAFYPGSSPFPPY